MITRRTFLKASVAAAAGLVLPSWLERADNYINYEDQPYLEPLKSHREKLYASRWEYDGYALSLGRPDAEPNVDLTWAEFIEDYNNGQAYFDAALEDGHSLLTAEDRVDSDVIFNEWLYEKDPIRQAYRFLENADLGKELGCGKGGGGLRFYDGFSPMHDAQYVAAIDNMTLSLLQKRLNQIDGTIAISLDYL